MKSFALVLTLGLLIAIPGFAQNPEISADSEDIAVQKIEIQEERISSADQSSDHQNPETRDQSDLLVSFGDALGPLAPDPTPMLSICDPDEAPQLCPAGCTCIIRAGQVECWFC